MDELMDVYCLQYPDNPLVEFIVQRVTEAKERGDENAEAVGKLAYHVIERLSPEHHGSDPIEAGLRHELFIDLANLWPDHADFKPEWRDCWRAEDCGHEDHDSYE